MSGGRGARLGKGLRSLAAAAGLVTGAVAGLAGLARPASAVTPSSAGPDVSISVLLAGQSPAGLAQLASAVSEPGSAEYRHYVTPDQFSTRFGASAATISAVSAALAARGLSVTGVWPDHMGLTAEGPSDAVDAALKASVSSISPAVSSRASLAGATLVAEGRSGVATDSVRLLPLGAGTARSHAAAAHAAAGCPADVASDYTPGVVAQAYGMGSLLTPGSAGVTIGLFELADYSASDVAAFDACFAPGANAPTRLSIDGGAKVGAGTSEATFDIEAIQSLDPKAHLLVYEAPDTAQGVLDDYAAMVSQDRAGIISTSWGVCESKAGSLVQAEAKLFEQAAVQGQTVLAASGDEGSSDCGGSGLSVHDPASQPFVTGVGGTSLTSASPRQETTWNSDGASGGGISSQWPMPSWQDGVAGRYSSGTPCHAGGLCREVPDVSASADPHHGYLMYCTAGDCSSGAWVSAGGTSIATPVWASVVALADQSCGRSAGFLNPLLYSTPGVTNLVTTGNNDTSGAPGGLYPAGPGYSMATGLGSPDATALAAALCAGSSAVTTGGAAGTGTPAGQADAGQVSGPAAAAGGTPGPAATADGFRVATTAGGVFTYGDAGFYGSVLSSPSSGGAGAVRLAQPIVGMAATPDGRGYWLVSSDGGVFTYGDAGFYGSLPSSSGSAGAGAVHLAQPIVGMTATPDGRGYWLVSSDGGVFTYGDAAFYGSLPSSSGSAGARGVHLSRPIVGMASTPDGRGYWLAAADGGVFSYGDAGFFGSGTAATADPVVSVVSLPAGNGYWLTTSSGRVMSFGQAPDLGSAGLAPGSVRSMASTPDGGGYWMLTRSDQVLRFGDAPSFGPATGHPSAVAITGA